LKEMMPTWKWRSHRWIQEMFCNSTRIAAIAAVLLMASAAVRTQAQLSSASVNGTVTDQSGAVIPDAAVALRATDTGVARTTTTNESGNYAFVDVAPGNYTLNVSKSGFSTAQQTAVTLVVNQTATFNFALQVGSQVEKVEVSEAAVPLETTVSNLGTVFSPAAMNNLPLNGRNFTQLLTLTPGSGPKNTAQNSSGVQGIFVGSLDFPAVNGQWNRSNLFLLDGINNQHVFYSEYAVPPIVDAIQEFKMQSHNDQSQFGGVLGGVVNVVTKSGGNDFHGDVWEFLRNDAFDAANPLLGKKTPLKQSVYGGTIGGPVLAPHYNGRNRMFFFGAYEGSNIDSANEGLYKVPTTAELNGDFSGISQQLFNPFTTTPDPAKPGSYLRTPFANNNIAAAMDPNMVALAKAVFPAPVQAPNGLNGEDTRPRQTNQNNYSLRADKQINPSNLLWGRFNQVHASQTGSGGFIGLNAISAMNAQNWTASFIHTFGSTSTLNVQVGHVWHFYKSLTTLTSASASTIQNSGFNQNFVCNYVGPLACQLPILAITGYLSGGQNYTVDTDSNIYEYKADYTRLIKRHVIALGTDLNFESNNVGQANPNLGFSSFQTSNLESSANTGDAMASFLLGVPSTAERRNLVKNLEGGKISGFYFQDQWKITPRLTMNWGGRYDLLIQEGLGSSPTKSNYTGSYNFANGTYVLAKTAATAPSCATSPASPCIPNGTLPANVVVASGDKLIDNDYDNIQPRLGFAYQIRHSTVLHLSYSRVFDSWSALTQAVQNEGALWPSVGLQLVNNLNSTTVTRSAEDPLNLGNQPAVLPAATPFNQVAYFVAPHLKNPYSDQWLFGVQQQLAGSMLLSVNYVGSRSTRLPCCDYYNVAVTPGAGTPQSRAPFPYAAPTHYEQSNGSSNYHSLQAQLQRQLNNGLSYTFNYTWSKTIDVACDGAFGVEGCFVRNPYNPRMDRSVAGFDMPQMFTGTVQYALPFGDGQRFHSDSRIVNTITGGWQVNAIATVTSGYPFTVSYSGDRANTGNDFQGVDIVGSPNLSNPSKTKWFNTAAFQTPAQYTYGQVGRNTLRSQNYADLDFSLFRTFTFERVKAEFRGEAFNGLNHPVLGTPQATLNSATFGQVLSTASVQRELQFVGKIYF